MVEFLKNNIRLIVIALLVVGIVFVVANSGSNDTEEQASDETSAVENGEEANGEADGSEQSSNRVLPTINLALPQPRTESEVTKDDNELYIVAVEGDNQSTMARKVVAVYLADQEKELAPGQLLFIETTLVREAGARDAIAVGEEVRVPSERLSELVSDAEALSEERIAAWESYL